MPTVAFVSDIHANIWALRAVLADIDARQVQATYCLGDLVGYGVSPNEVIRLIREKEIPTILGNYDDGIAFERGHCGCYYPDARSKSIGDSSYAFTQMTVTRENKAWLRSLPGERRLTCAGWRLHLVHGSPRRINEYLYPGRTEKSFLRIARLEQADMLVFGHTHTSWHNHYGQVFFVNVGSVGRPRDGDPRAAYTVLLLEESAVPSIEVHRVRYDVERTVQAVVAAGLPLELAEAFRCGT